MLNRPKTVHLIGTQKIRGPRQWPTKRIRCEFRERKEKEKESI
jgi:hypothetical protein